MTGCTSGTSVPARVSSSRRRRTGYRPNVRAARRLEDLGRARPRPATQIVTTAALTYAAAHARKPRLDANPGLFRVALKMATGTGKTVVMAMLIAWQALNKAAQTSRTPASPTRSYSCRRASRSGIGCASFCPRARTTTTDSAI